MFLTRFKSISKIGSFPQVGVNWNHHLHQICYHFGIFSWTPLGFHGWSSFFTNPKKMSAQFWETSQEPRKHTAVSPQWNSNSSEFDVNFKKKDRCHVSMHFLFRENVRFHCPAVVLRTQKSKNRPRACFAGPTSSISSSSPAASASTSWFGSTGGGTESSAMGDWFGAETPEFVGWCLGFYGFHA